MVKVNFVKMNRNAKAPTYGSQSAAGADLYACNEESVMFEPGETKIVHTGISVEIPEGYAGFIYARSGIATKRGLAPANKVGVIDSDYRGEIMVALYNHTNISQEISAGERIAQIVIAPFLKAEFYECEKLSDTNRGSEGFGSTGTK